MYLPCGIVYVQKTSQPPISHHRPGYQDGRERDKLTMEPPKGATKRTFSENGSNWSIFWANKPRYWCLTVSGAGKYAKRKLFRVSSAGKHAKRKLFRPSVLSLFMSDHISDIDLLNFFTTFLGWEKFSDPAKCFGTGFPSTGRGRRIFPDPGKLWMRPKGQYDHMLESLPRGWRDINKLSRPNPG